MYGGSTAAGGESNSSPPVSSQSFGHSTAQSLSHHHHPHHQATALSYSYPYSGHNQHHTPHHHHRFDPYGHFFATYNGSRMASATTTAPSSTIHHTSNERPSVSPTYQGMWYSYFKVIKRGGEGEEEGDKKVKNAFKRAHFPLLKWCHLNPNLKKAWK